jgi:hypothetical protein
LAWFAKNVSFEAGVDAGFGAGVSGEAEFGQVPFYLGKDYGGITRGNDIYFRPDQYDPTTAAGLSLLGHELVHVGQYRNGMTWASYIWSTRHGYESSPYEKEAYAMQRRILNDLAASNFEGCAKPASP